MRRPLCLVCLIFVILIIGIVEIFPYEYDFPNDLSGEVVLVEGKVSKKETKEKNGQTIYYIYLEQIMLQSDSNADNVGDRDSKIQKLNMAEGILCYMEENSYIPNIGSRVQISGEISVFEKPDNPGEFNTALYYKIKGIDLKMYDCELVAYTENYDVIVEKLFRLKESLCNILDNCFRYEYRGIAKAILLGMSGEVDEDTKELYQRNGMLHILCVSGLHISILGMGLFKLLKKLRIPDSFNVVFCIFFMSLYGIMIGMGTSVIRAILMFSLRLVAKLLDRTYDLLTAACVGIFLILFEQPLYIYHSGFLLSFLSVVALGAFRPLFPEKICKVDFVNKRADSFFSSLTVWLVTLPVYGRYYYEVSLAGLLLNVLILPFVSVVLVLVIVVCVLGSFYQPLGMGIAKVCEVFLWTFEKSFECFDAVGNTTLIIGYIPLYKCLLYYTGLVILLFAAEKMKRCYLYLGIITACLLLIGKMPKPLTITCLSVGQGDSAVVEYMDLVCVIDAGSSTESEVAKYTILPFLKYRGIREIDYLFLTHADSDHINGVKEMLSQNRNGIRVERIVITDGRYSDEYGGIWEMAIEQEIPVYEMKQGNFVSVGKLQIECLGPDEKMLDRVNESTNETSMVLLLKKEDFSMLFTGDTEGKGEEALTDRMQEREIGNLTALKVAHHGSKYSTEAEFLETAVPKLSIISCGTNNSYGHPHTETLERLAMNGSKVFVTKDCGAVTIEVGEEIEVHSWKKSTK